jgi:hypothetical protein
MNQRISISAVLVTPTMATSFGQTIVETFDARIPTSWTIHDNFPIPGSPDFSVVPLMVNTAEAMGHFTNGTPSLAAPGLHCDLERRRTDVRLSMPRFALRSVRHGGRRAGQQ